VVSLEVFAVTEFNEIFLGRQPRQGVKFFDVSRLTRSLSTGCASGLVAQKPMIRCPTQHRVEQLVISFGVVYLEILFSARSIFTISITNRMFLICSSA
jgi:hypothetical protein